MKDLLFIPLLVCLLSFVQAQPLDDIVQRTTTQEKNALAYAPVREADIFWEKRIWRVIDVREKMNLAFTYPEAPFFNILTDAVENGEITLYSAETDDFSYPLSQQEINDILFTTDTIPIFDPETYKETYQVISESINYEDVKRYRLKELWYFDSQTGTMRVRILGIAPIHDVTDANGNFRYEQPLFWAYYPELREVLAHHEVFNPENESSRITWEDLLEMRFFASTIYKESNIKNDRLQDMFSGLDLLHEADKIKQKIFNYEHDLWSY